MHKFVSLLLVGILCVVYTDAAECESGWTAYKDETCLKIFPDFVTYDDAKNLCAANSNSVSTGILVMVKEVDIQEFIAEFTKESLENIWLGGKYNNATAEFRWEDGSPLTFANWANGYPRNITNSEMCIQLRPGNSITTTQLGGKWEDTVCQRRNLAMCQRTLTWSLEDATREIVALRKRLVDTAQDLETTKVYLNAVNDRVVPVGSIYIEYYNQPAPKTLWPTLSWQDVSSTYAGMFFRTYGGNSGQWGSNQGGCAPRISHYDYNQQREFINPIVLPKSGWSTWGKAGWHPNGGSNLEVARFHVEDCEVRPQNQAVRIWKRTA